MTELVPRQVSECALHLGPKTTCLDDDVAAVIKARTGSADTVAAIKKVGCDSEKCLVTKVLGNHAILQRNFKIDGPTDSSLLSNIDIDSILKQWTAKWKDFYPYNFNMRDYASYRFENGQVVNEPDSLATIQFADLYEQGYRTGACVINSDRYAGGGKHWMALFVDARGTGPVTVEFFNSSGGSPALEWNNWLTKTRDAMSENRRAKIVLSTTQVHQKSMSECGVYSLFYIWARLNGMPPDYFARNKIEDKVMFEFRQHLFAGERAVEDGVFDWDKFKKAVRIKWA